MKRILLMMTLTLLAGFSAHAADEKTPEQEDQELEATKTTDPALITTLKEKYGLTDDQVKSLQDKGLSTPQMLKMSVLASESGKPLDEIMKMRLEMKMGWGRIAKELGLHPGLLGRSVASFKNGKDHTESDVTNPATTELSADSKMEKLAQRADRAGKKAEKQAAKAERGHGHGKGH
jgi:hypothetical protein